ncbi:protein of unknown function [Tistlia consotensis]|uniref:DUF1849 family protein n=1 Tax=Tistlia consotensis USBA 355 TaxID=560819 RepID=A0A1Y6CAP9_9PROT|nr:DUF1849 family protein [Tistlia consotensis]SMF43332.1 protein of unknown function [Tistlia consotensis USBA 355]SNR42465.1 protein of unknown function [Tistlia consotensis]
MRCLFPAVFIVLVTTGVANPAAAGPQEAALKHAIERFQPHRASYELTLERARSSDVSAASGQLSFEWADACDGWTVRQLTRMEVSRGQEPSLDFGWRFDSWEAKDGTSYRFFIDRFDHGRKSETISGRASLQAVGKAGTAHFDEPVERDVPLPAGTIFPTWHSYEMIAMAEAGQQQIWRTVFDGSADDDGLSEVSAVRSDGKKPVAAPKVGADLLAGLEAHRIFLAYYSTDPSRSEPVHEQEVLIYGNGVADDFVFDYGDFALRARLVELEALPKPKC